MKNAILLHLHYQDLWPEFWSYLKYIKDENTHLYVTVHTENTPWYSDIKANATEVYVIENKGMDFGGFLYAYSKIKHIDYLTITKLHGKKSLRAEPGSNMPGPKEAGGGEKWRKGLYLPLIETKEKYLQNINLFQNVLNLFMIGSKPYIKITNIDVDKHTIFVHTQMNWIDKLLEIKDISRKIHISGSMFTCTKTYLDEFFKNKELELLSHMEEGYSLLTAGHHLECTICNCEYFGGQILGI